MLGGLDARALLANKPPESRLSEVRYSMDPQKNLLHHVQMNHWNQQSHRTFWGKAVLRLLNRPQFLQSTTRLIVKTCRKSSLLEFSVLTKSGVSRGSSSSVDDSPSMRINCRMEPWLKLVYRVTPDSWVAPTILLTGTSFEHLLRTTSGSNRFRTSTKSYIPSSEIPFKLQRGWNNEESSSRFWYNIWKYWEAR